MTLKRRYFVTERQTNHI